MDVKDLARILNALSEEQQHAFKFIEKECPHAIELEDSPRCGNGEDCMICWLNAVKEDK